jgi:hypothetical protein
MRSDLAFVDPEGRKWGSLAIMASAYGLSGQTVHARLRRGLTLAQALRPVGSVKHPRTGLWVSWKALAKDLGVSESGLRRRYNEGLFLDWKR